MSAGIWPFLEKCRVYEAGVVVDELEHKQLEAIAHLVLGLGPRLLQVGQEGGHPTTV